METDPVLALALSMKNGPGTYAVLVGSGVSSAAGIPTGWAVLEDLIRQLAKLEGEDAGEDAPGWYAARYGQPPSYSEVLEALAPAPGDRLMLLRRYFEPTEEEAEQGLKLPTAAHRALAHLVQSGHVRVIITTNFDHLIENALREIGIEAAVVATPDAVQGAMPLAHAPCTVAKLHGDYLDPRFLNTPSELADYDARINRLLDQVLDEYGLVTCGWSADWDAALRSAVERCTSRRFTTYWAARGELGEQAKRLVAHRAARVIRVPDADSFFSSLLEKVEALGEIDSTPLSLATAVATVKRYLRTPHDRIRLHDLVIGEADRVAGRLAVYDSKSSAPTPESLRQRVHEYERLVETLAGMVATGCYWSDEPGRTVWVECVTRIGKANRVVAGYNAWVGMKAYPALFLLYAGGIAALANGSWNTLAGLLALPIVYGRWNHEASSWTGLHPNRVFPDGTSAWLPGMNEGKFTPVSDYLFEQVIATLSNLVPDEDDFTHLFDAFEWLRAAYASSKGEDWALGSFGWRWRRELLQDGRNPLTEFREVSSGFWDSGLFLDEQALADAEGKVTEAVKERNWF